MVSKTGPKQRPEKVVPYVHRIKKNDKPSSFFNNTMPLAAMFMKNKLLAWTALFISLQSYLNEPFLASKDSQPGWTAVVTAIVGIFTCYMDFVMPPKPRIPPTPTPTP